MLGLGAYFVGIRYDQKELQKKIVSQWSIITHFEGKTNGEEENLALGHMKYFSSSPKMAHFNFIPKEIGKTGASSFRLTSLPFGW